MVEDGTVLPLNAASIFRADSTTLSQISKNHGGFMINTTVRSVMRSLLLAFEAAQGVLMSLTLEHTQEHNSSLLCLRECFVWLECNLLDDDRLLRTNQPHCACSKHYHGIIPSWTLGLISASVLDCLYRSLQAKYDWPIPLFPHWRGYSDALHWW